MNYLQNVQKGIDYIESNLDFELPLGKVAREAGISQWHFQRIFKALTNETLKLYIRSRRLSNSLNELLNTRKKIIDIAFNAGFESQESFTRAFKKAFELTPNQYRKQGNNSLILKKVEINSDYLNHINQNISLTLPPSTYAKFTHKGAAKAFDKTVNYIYSTWLLQSGKHHTYGADIEFYGPEYHPVSSKSTMYYAIPISD